MGVDQDLTDDGFLGGRLRILQPRGGYRAATDPVLLAAAVSARQAETVLDLGCGVGVASLCLAARVPGLVLTGVERQAAYADLARRNAARNGLAMTVVEADLAALPAELRSSYDHVIANPPYYSPGAGTSARNPGREAALREETPLAVWIDTATRRLRPGGWLTLIQDAARFPDLVAALDDRLGSVTLLPVQPRDGREASRIILRARKGSRAAARLLAPLVLHHGPAHLADGDDFTPEVRAILRDGVAIDRP